MICISIGEISQVKEVNSLKPDLVEIRLDLLQQPPSDILNLLDKGMKIIATCRPGNHDTEEERFSMLEKAMKWGVDYIDIEIEAGEQTLSSARQAATETGTELIISWHDFQSTPPVERLREILHDCYLKGADVAKIATMARTYGDSARLLSLYDEPGRKVVLGMGELGRVTRFAALLLGAEFTFATTRHSAETAPGQPSYEELLNLHKIMASK